MSKRDGLVDCAMFTIVGFLRKSLAYQNNTVMTSGSSGMAFRISFYVFRVLFMWSRVGLFCQKRRAPLGQCPWIQCSLQSVLWECLL